MEYYKTKESVEEYIELAKDVDSAQLIDKLKEVLPDNSSMLEIGSGPGTDWNILNKFYNVTGSDFSAEFLQHLVDKNPSGEFLELDAITLETDKTFDGIYANKVLHHLRDNELEKSIENQYNILNPQGIICHSYWKGKGSEVFKGLFVNYHDEKSLMELYSAQFEILTIETYKEFEEEDSLLIIAKKR